jgi:hypothetical protein
MRDPDKLKRRGISLLLLGPVLVALVSLFGLRGTAGLWVLGAAVAIAVVGAAIVLAARRV